MPYNQCTCEDTPCERRATFSCCLAWVTAILAALTLFVAGVLVGSFLSLLVLGSLAAFVVLAIVLAVITMAFAVLTMCRRNRGCCGG